MTIKTDIPVVIRPEAATRIAELGIQREVEQMLEYTRHNVPGLESIEIEAWDDEFEPGQPHLRITGWRPGCISSKEDLLPEREWGSWFVRAFVPDVLRWFSFFICYRNEHAR
jgi:hypothetical protein